MANRELTHSAPVPARTKLAITSAIWNPLASHPDIKNVVEPAVALALKDDISHGPWVLARQMVTLLSDPVFQAEIGSRYAQGKGFDSMSLSAKRRYSMAAIVIAYSLGAEDWFRQGIMLEDIPGKLRAAVEEAKLMATYLGEDKRVLNGLIKPRPVEGRAVLPLLCLWQVVGPIMRHLDKNGASTAEKEALLHAVRYTVGLLPERPEAEKLWNDTAPVIRQVFGGDVFLGNWIGGGHFKLDPYSNPVAMGSVWSQKFQREPMFVALGQWANSLAKAMPEILNVVGVSALGDGSDGLMADEIGCLKNLGDENSLYGAGRYFNPSVSFSLTKTDDKISPRTGEDPGSPLRVRALRQCFDLWKQTLLEKTKEPLLDIHLNKQVTLRTVLADEDWQGYTTDQIPSSVEAVAMDAADILSPAFPWGNQGRQMALNQLHSVFVARKALVENIVRIPGDLSLAAADPKHLEVVTDNLYKLKLIKSKSQAKPTEGEGSLEASRIYWRNFLAGQPNPFYALENPRNLILQCAPVAYYHKLSGLMFKVITSGQSVPEADGVKMATESERLASQVWRAAMARAKANPGASYEECLFAGAIEIAMSKEQRAVKFTGYHAHVLAFMAGMGSDGKRLMDETKASRTARAELLNGRQKMTDLLASGRAAVVAQLLTDWTKFAKANNAAQRVDNPALKGLGVSIEKLADANLRLSGKTPLGSALCRPEFWQQILSPEAEKLWARIAQGTDLPSAAMSKQAGYVLLQPEYGTLLGQVQQATNNIAAKPAELKNYWQKAVLELTAEFLSPMLDAFTMGNAATWHEKHPPLVTIFDAIWQKEMSSSEPWTLIYPSLVAQHNAAFPSATLSPTVPSETSPGETIGRWDQFIQWEFTKAPGLMLHLLKNSNYLDAGQVKAAKQHLSRIFTPRGKVLPSSTQAVAWSRMLNRVLQIMAQDEPAQAANFKSLQKAVQDFIVIDERIRPLCASAGTRHPVNWASIDQQYGQAGSQISEILASSTTFEQPKVWWHLRSVAERQMTVEFEHMAKEIEKVKMGETQRLATRTAQAKVATTLHVAMVNLDFCARQFVANPSVGEPKPKLRQVAEHTASLPAPARPIAEPDLP